MASVFTRYARWLHTGWPAGAVEKLPEVNADGTCALRGVRVVGDLRGVPLLKLAADSGARAVHAILEEPDFAAARGRDPSVLDLAIVGAGISGVAAAIEAHRAGLRYALYESAEEFSTVRSFPRRKPIYTYPSGPDPAGHLKLRADVKEGLLDELTGQRAREGVAVTRATATHLERSGAALAVCFADADRAPARALRVIVAIGRSGGQRRLDVPGEDSGKVFQRLFDPADHAGREVLVVGGGDSALEAAIALAGAGARVTLAHRGHDFLRAKPDSVAAVHALHRARALTLLLGARVSAIRDREVEVTVEGEARILANDAVFCLIGRLAPLDFFRRSAIPIRGEWRIPSIAGFAAFLVACLFLYSWKASTGLNDYFHAHRLFPFNLPESLCGSGFARALAVSLRQPGFHYSLAYTVAIGLFGWKRIRRRRTPYVTRQTLTLFGVQLVPLFLLPYFILPMLGYAGVFDSGFGRTVADNLFPAVSYDYGREYWRAFGLVLAWPLFVWNLFTGRPMTWWLVIGVAQTFVVLPLIVRRWGKGAYCGWICSCGALAETLGDTHREKMPHGPGWNRLNLVGQVLLAWAMLLFLGRILVWTFPGSGPARIGQWFYDRTFYAHAFYDYYHLVDIFLAGVVGLGAYFWLSGRVWCRFACPLAALMHIYARFSRFRIFADKPRCISCNLCTAVCHQGIDVMAFAARGQPMEDPECVRCSACVHACPTATLSFGRLDDRGVARLDGLEASPVRLREVTLGRDGKKHLRTVA